MKRALTILLGAGGILAIAAGGTLAVTASLPARAVSTSHPPQATATVERKTVKATTSLDGTLGYPDPRTIANLLAAGGPAAVSVITQEAQPGSILHAGDVLYTVNGATPVVLMAGSTPAWRDLRPSDSPGADIRQLETNLRGLGYAPSSMKVDETWDANTTTAVKRWQKSMGLSRTGVIPLGQIVFMPNPLRVTQDTAALGSVVGRGSPVLNATSTKPVITVQLDPALQSEVKAGDAVMVTLPSGSIAAARITDIGKVATVPDQGSATGGGGKASIEVVIALDDPSAAGSLDEAPVSVSVTTATAQDALAVPVTALVELLEGGYAVQVERNATLQYVPVTLGLFADGWVQVTGSGLAPGDTVVVAQ